MHESGEMYLETILVLSKKMGTVRAIDICDHMGFSKPSVSRAMGILKKDEHITVDAHGSIKLTASGREIAERIYERHNVLADVLWKLGVDKDVAAEDACKIEHYISDETFEAIKKHVSECEKAKQA